MVESVLIPEDGKFTPKFYQSRINAAKKFWSSFMDISAETENIYRAQPEEQQFLNRTSIRIRPSLNIFYSNVETLVPILYGAQPKAHVTTRIDTRGVSMDVEQQSQTDKGAAQATQQFGVAAANRNALEKSAAVVLERAIDYQNDNDLHSLDSTMYDATQDLEVVGMGVTRIIHDVTKMDKEVTKKREVMDEATGEMTLEDFVERETEIQSQEVPIKYVNWRNFLIFPCRSWDTCTAIAFRHIMSPIEVKEQFQGFDNRIFYNVDVEGNNMDVGSAEKSQKSEKGGIEKGTHAIIWEIWDKDRKKRVWLADSFEEAFLKEPEDDPLNLTGFFPCPEPLWANRTGNTIIPRSDYLYYRTQHEELNRVTERLRMITEGLRANGVYDSNFDSLQTLSRKGDNVLIPVTNWEKLQAKGGLQAAVQIMNISERAQVIPILQEREERIKQNIFEIIGMADIMRARTDAPEEKATSLILKSKFGMSRVSRRQMDVQNHIKRAMQLQGEVIAEQFTTKSLLEVAGIAVSDQVIQFLRDNKLRMYRIDIQSDVTSQLNAETERQARLEFTNTFMNTLTQYLPLMEAGVPPVAVQELLKFLTNSFKAADAVGSSIDAIIPAISEAQQKAQEAAAQQPDVQQQLVEVEAAKVEVAQQKAALDAQAKQQKLELDAREKEFQAQQKIAELESKREEEALRLEIETEKLQLKRDELLIRNKELEMQAQLEVAKLQQGQDISGNITGEVADLGS